MTIADIIDDRRELAKYLGVTYEAGVKFTGFHQHPETVTADEKVADAYADYRNQLRADWNKSAANPWKEKTTKQLIAECLTHLGIKGGKVADRIQRAIAMYPDLYQSATSSAANAA